jgi:hypothetical protein
MTDFRNLGLNNELQTLIPTTCNSPMSRIFDVVKHVKLNPENLTELVMTSPVSANTKQWFKITDHVSQQVISIMYFDTTNTTYDYHVAIRFNPTDDCCNTNPLKNCMETCIGDTVPSPCIITNTSDKSGGYISDTIPDSIIDEALRMLTIYIPWWIYGGLAVGAVGLIWLFTRK